VTVRAGDVVVIPAGVAHRNMDSSDDVLVVGAYPGGSEYDICRGDPADYDKAICSICAVLMPGQDPVFGRHGPLWQLWAVGAR
jgi:uncharacterized protein YjlB